ncbi:Pkinase-domain-containing protein [Mycena chlorophos]|uniref:Pkinase-domain-containing protein n=1 Tax=Mycena chlorophos TaxID=658473 RepID=A0A8H6SXL7_MYCCL|nr:Pkinase-domain-containing protein [Mycena chlorophos]
MTIRVLALHGHSQNAVMFEKLLQTVRNACGPDVEFVYVAAPMVLPSSKSSETNEPGRSWYEWLSARSTAQDYSSQLVASVLYLRDILASQPRAAPIDGILGFSQGAAMSALLTALLERPHAFPPFLIDGKPPHAPFKFCIAASGFIIPSTVSDTAFSGGGYATPTLHFIGRKDALVKEPSSRALVAVSKEARLELHDGGHELPTSEHWAREMADFILRHGRTGSSLSKL